LANGTASTDAVTKSQLDNVNSTLTASTVNLTSAQTISGAKTFTGSIKLPVETVLTKQDNNLEGGQIVFQRANNDPSYQDPTIDLYNGDIRFLYCNAVEVPASAALHTAVSTTGISKAGNGYVKFGNGIIIQWGLNTNGDQITFLTPYTTNPCVSICGNNTSGNTETASSAVGTVSTTGFKLLLSRGGWTAQWIAIGY
jgi:hypothetical protein